MKSITKDQFVALLDGAGITDAQKHRLHALFEQHHPDGHQHFLAYLGIPPDGIAKIRQQSRQP
ncbi:MAG TPA: hypothetical protein VHE13_12905 [Opitutus sp.]|nr:hypothetical protein [Opitutus sp.]